MPGARIKALKFSNPMRFPGGCAKSKCCGTDNAVDMIEDQGLADVMESGHCCQKIFGYQWPAIASKARQTNPDIVCGQVREHIEHLAANF